MKNLRDVLKHEHSQHAHHIDHARKMHELQGSKMPATQADSGKSFGGAPYKNEVDAPKGQKIGSGTGSNELGRMHCCSDYKAEASDQAFGQSGKSGLMSDEKKIMSQFNHSYTDDAGY